MYNLQLDITTVIFEEGAWLTMAHYQVVLPSAKMLVDIATDVPPPWPAAGRGVCYSAGGIGG